MIKDIIYVVTDGEFNGPRPGPNSMLSFASVAVTHAGQRLGEFEACLLPLDGSSGDAETMAFWQSNPEAYAAATLDPLPPDEVMRRYTRWIRGLSGDCVFVSHPVALDGLWIDYYLRLFTQDQLLEGPWRPDRLFKAAPLCLVSFAAAVLKRGPLDNNRYPDEWLGHEVHSHKAIDDARGYAHLLVRLLEQSQR